MNSGNQPVRYILIGTPSVFEQFLAEGGHGLRTGEVAGPPTPADIERLKAAAPKFGITLLRDWPATCVVQASPGVSRLTLDCVAQAYGGTSADARAFQTSNNEHPNCVVMSQHY